MGQGQPEYDVVVVGAGNAALCAALSAREQGASVVVLEKAPPSAQGGNCPYTGGGFRFFHGGLGDLRSLLPDLSDEEAARVEMAPYSADDFRSHLLSVTRGEADPDLMEVLISRSRPTVDWMRSKGVRWELPSSSSVYQGVPSAIPSSVGLRAWQSGQGLVQMLTKATRRSGIDILYETRMVRLLQDSGGGVCGVLAEDAEGVHRVHGRGVVLTCGGFEANAEMRARHLGAGWERARVRGARFNTGDGHHAAMEVGAQPWGQWTGCHATPIDVEAPSTGDLALTDRMPRRSFPLGITVNLKGRRFVDEGEGFAEQTFVRVARRIMEQPEGVAFQVFDAKALPLLEPRYGTSKSAEANTIHDLAKKVGIAPSALKETVDSFNAEAHRGQYDPGRLDGRSTRTLKPPKGNWAIKIDAPPFSAFTVTGGITYTDGGLRIDTKARVLNTEDEPIPGLFAAGEIVGGIFHHNSLRGAGLMHGSVFGRLAGANAAKGR